MSAEERRHEDAPKKIDERVIFEERLSLMQTPESKEIVAPAQQWVRDADRHSEIPSSVAPERDETRDRLLCAISDTEIGKRMRDLMQADPHEATPFPTAAAGVQPSARVVQAAPAVGPARTFIVQTSPTNASMPLMPLAATQPRHPAPPEPDSIIEKEKARDRLLHAISEAGAAEGEIPTSDPQFRSLVQTSPQAASMPLMPPATVTPHRRVLATPRKIEAVTLDVVPQVPTSPPQPMAVAESAPPITTASSTTPVQDRSPRTTIFVWYSVQINRLNAKLARTTKSMGRALWSISVQFKNRVMAKTSSATKSANTTGLQISTGLGDCAHATQSATSMESISEAGPQSPTRFQKWLGPRRSSRLTKPPVIAYCWTADTPDPIKIADISSGGVHLLTDARWPCGGVLSMTLQRTDRTSETPESWVVIDFIVIRLCSDGVAGAFIPSTHRLSRFIPSRAENCADDRTLKRFVRHLAVSNSA